MTSWKSLKLYSKRERLLKYYSDIVWYSCLWYAVFKKSLTKDNKKAKRMQDLVRLEADWIGNWIDHLLARYIFSITSLAWISITAIALNFNRWRWVSSPLIASVYLLNAWFCRFRSFFSGLLESTILEIRLLPVISKFKRNPFSLIVTTSHTSNLSNVRSTQPIKSFVKKTQTIQKRKESLIILVRQYHLSASTFSLLPVKRRSWRKFFPLASGIISLFVRHLCIPLFLSTRVTSPWPTRRFWVHPDLDSCSTRGRTLEQGPGT